MNSAITRLWDETVQHLCEAIQPLQSMREAVIVSGPLDRDRRRVDLSRRLWFDAVRHSKGIAIEAWVDGERVCCMKPGQEIELVMYALLMLRLAITQEYADFIKMMSAYYGDVKANHPAAWQGFKDLDRGVPDDKQEAVDPDGGV